jgi:hypothetical protein
MPNCLANDSIKNCKIDYTKLQNGNTCLLFITFEAIYDTTYIPDTSSIASQERIENIKRQLTEQLVSKYNNYIRVDFPKYINEIINLIASEENRKKARRIYRNNGIIQVFKNNESSNSEVGSFSKKFHSKIYCEFTISLINTKGLTFDIKPIVFKYYDKTYYSNSLSIKF